MTSPTWPSPKAVFIWWCCWTCIPAKLSVDATHPKATAGAGYVSHGIQEPVATARIAASL
ncbi:MAG: hypothetical protein CL609_10780 [Anaerolineaceae bacterium]|nr:hypothetical protein [Anaerolineaceae bacterium]